MADDLADFLRARLDEDYRLAFEAGNGGQDEWIYNPTLPWESAAGPREAVVRFNGSALGYVAAVDPVHGKYGTWNARHIAHWDPTRVLAEVDAKRRIIDEHHDVNDGSCGTCVTPGWGYPTHGGTSPASWPCQTLRLLARPYAAHPDYRPEWAPDG